MIKRVDNMNFITVKNKMTQQQACYFLGEVDQMALTQEIGAFCGKRIIYFDCIDGKVKYSFVDRQATGNKNEAEVSRFEVLQFLLNP
jgi:hypothetical protein